MTVPSVNFVEKSGGLGSLPAGRTPLVVVGVCSSTDATVLNLPAAYARISDVETAFVGGPLVRAAASLIATYGAPVICVAADDVTPGSCETVVGGSSGSGGTSVVTTSVQTATDDFEIVMVIVNGGTIATAGITYQISLDGGNSYGPVTALGTANTLAIGATGVTFAFAAGTVVAGRTVSVVTHAPLWDATSLGAALTALDASSLKWRRVIVVGDCTPTLAATVSTWAGLKKNRCALIQVAKKTSAQTEAQYLSTLATAWSSFASDSVGKVAGSCRYPDGQTKRSYRVSPIVPIGGRWASQDEDVDISSPLLGALPGVSIRDANGNAAEHDELINPGLSDAGFIVLRTFDSNDPSGVYVNDPVLSSSSGSDFMRLQHRDVMGLAYDALRKYFTLRLSKDVLVGKNGFILETEALEIENGANAVLRAVLLAKPKASAATFTLYRFDNLLSGAPMTGNYAIVPKAYPKNITLTGGFSNPANSVRVV